MKVISKIEITPEAVMLNGCAVTCEGKGSEMLNFIYRRYVGNYPKFHKMDGLCKLGFLSSELLLNGLDEVRFTPRSDRAIVLFNSSSSIDADRHYQDTISDLDNFYPSPSVFVYTLPNIVTGEIAMRNNYLGETSFYVLDHYDKELIAKHVSIVFSDEDTDSIITGWIDYYAGDDFKADLKLIIR